MKTTRPIVITGFMGCGKTAVARSLADRLRREMFDLDQVITEREGRPPARLIEDDGENAFRLLETGALRDLLKSESSAVVALGGGAWIEEVNRDLIYQSGAISIWLDTPFDVCWQRITASGEDRPLGKTRPQARELYERRRPVYQLAGVRLQTHKDESSDDLALRIEAEIADQ